MKHKNWLFGLVSVLAVVFGLSFPGITATVEDQNAGDLADFYKITNPQLAPPVLLPDVIRLISGKYTRVDLESGKVLTEDDVYRAATDAAEFWLPAAQFPYRKTAMTAFKPFRFWPLLPTVRQRRCCGSACFTARRIPASA